VLRRPAEPAPAEADVSAALAPHAPGAAEDARERSTAA
jgi:hypothetical protein